MNFSVSDSQNNTFLKSTEEITTMRYDFVSHTNAMGFMNGNLPYKEIRDSQHLFTVFHAYLL